MNNRGDVMLTSEAMEATPLAFKYASSTKSGNGLHYRSSTFTWVRRGMTELLGDDTPRDAGMCHVFLDVVKALVERGGQIRD